MKKFWNFIVLALIGGGFGLQEFYMERWGLAILAVLFFWTGIPALVGFIEAASWLFRGEDEFNAKFGTPVVVKPEEKEKELLND